MLLYSYKFPLSHILCAEDMENTIRSRETAVFTVPALAAPIAPAVAFLISCFVGFYNGIPAPRPVYTPPDIATYIMDAAARRRPA